MTDDLRALSAAVREVGPAPHGANDVRPARISELARQADGAGLAWLSLHLHEQRIRLVGDQTELIESAERIAQILEALHRPPDEISRGP